MKNYLDTAPVMLYCVGVSDEDTAKKNEPMLNKLLKFFGWCVVLAFIYGMIALAVGIL